MRRPFFARAIDTDKAGLANVLEAAHAFDGTALTEIFQNCIVYNKDVYASFTDRKTAQDTQLHLHHGEPMLFGKDKQLGIAFDLENYALKVVDASTDSEPVLVHDETNDVIARLLIALKKPVALGVIYRNPAPAYETTFYNHHPSNMQRRRSVADVIAGPNSWLVE